MVSRADHLIVNSELPPNMSKAFTKESDDEGPDSPPGQRASASLPPGARNYMTPGGAHRWRAEVARLEQVERLALANAPEQRRKLNQRIAEIEQILESAEIVPPPDQPEARQRVVFGATVTVREVRSGEESRYRIVGVDELDQGEDHVSLHAPIARALINRRPGERVRFRFPAGEEELEIIAIDYEDP